jgi:hypothetical protein
MAYATPTTIAVGDPVKKDHYDILAGNSVSHETRVLALESGSAVIDIFDTTYSNLSQYVNVSSTLEGIDRYQAKQALTLTGAIITDTEGATSSDFEFDILKATAIGGSYTTVFSTTPSLTANGSPQESSNAVFSVTSVAAGDWLRLDFLSIAVGASNVNISLTASPA